MTELTQERLKKLLSYDPDTGVFIWLVRPSHSHVHVGDLAGTKDPSGYIYIKISGKRYFAHRLAWLYVYGEWPRHNIDHKDGIGDNNRIANLRDVTQSINAQNIKKANADSKTGVLGVTRYKGGKYRALIMINGRNKHLGLFDTAEQAHNAYLETKRIYHAGFMI
jgi:hypothetical protein